MEGKKLVAIISDAASTGRDALSSVCWIVDSSAPSGS